MLYDIQPGVSRRADEMSPTLIHAMILSILYLGGSGVAWGVSRLGGMSPKDAVAICGAGGILAILVETWPILRHMRWRPLCLPQCSHCGRLPSGYRASGVEWPRVVFVCLDCEKPTETWMIRSVDTSRRSKEMPSLRLRWPEFIGWWTAS